MDRTIFSLEISEVDNSHFSIVLLSVGFFLFSFADILSFSPNVYMFCWCVGGAAVGIMAIIIFAIYIGSRMLSKQSIGPINVLLFTSLGWTSMYLANLIPSFQDILRNGFVVASIF